MKYLWSGVLCSQAATCFSLDCVKWMAWTGGSCFAACIITFWCIAMATYPGYSDLTKLLEWYDNTFDPIDYWSNLIWGVFNTVSTMVTVVGIYKIMKTMQQLKRKNVSIKSNYFQLTIHAIVVTLNLVSTITLCLPSAWLTYRKSAIFNIIFIVTETIS